MNSAVPLESVESRPPPARIQQLVTRGTPGYPEALRAAPQEKAAKPPVLSWATEPAPGGWDFPLCILRGNSATSQKHMQSTGEARPHQLRFWNPSKMIYTEMIPKAETNSEHGARVGLIITGVAFH